MKRKLRRMTVRDTAFLWRFHSRWDQCFLSHLIFLQESNLRNKITVCFQTRDTLTAGSPLNEGLPVVKDGQEIALNLNRPRDAAALLAFLLEKKVDFSRQKNYIFADGNSLLLEMGYRETGNYLITP